MSCRDKLEGSDYMEYMRMQKHNPHYIAAVYLAISIHT